MRIREKIFWGAVILICLLGLFYFVPYHPEICEKAPQTNTENCTSYNLLSFVFIEISKLLNDYGPAISALATIFIALFTFTLWKSTDRLWRADKTSFEARERAFVFIDGFNHEMTTGDKADIPDELVPAWYRGRENLWITRFAAQPRWKNGGNTPTRNMTIRTHWCGPTGNIQIGSYPAQPRPFFIAPKADEVGEFIEMSSAPGALVDYGLSNPTGAEPLILIWSRADYEDIFGHPHFVEWCYRLRIDRHDGKNLRAQFIQWGDYNRTD